MTNMNETLDILKTGDTVPADSLDHLVNQMALFVRATRPEYGLSGPKINQLLGRVTTMYSAYPEVCDRITTANFNKDRFWDVPSDSVLNRLHEAGILAESLGIA